MNFKVVSCQACMTAALVAFAPVSHADFLSDLFGSASKEPVVLPLSTAQILQDEVYAVDGKKISAWEVKEVKTKRKTSYQFVQVMGKESLPSTQIDAGSVVTSTGKVKLEKPIGVTFLKNGDVQLSYGLKKAPVIIDMELKAFDVSGQKIANYLKTKDGKESADAEKAGSATFPKGSIAYKAVTKFVNGEMVLPVRESFTNAKAPKDIVENFSSVPYCLSYEPRVGSNAYGITFNKAESKATSGKYTILPVRRDTIFCKPSGEPAVANGTWNLVKTARNTAVVLTIPSNVDPRDFGIKTHENGVAKVAFIAPGKGDHVFRPGRYYAKGSKLEGQNFLFNKVAALAVSNEIGSKF